MDLFHHIFMGCTNIMGHEPLKIHGKFMYYAYMIIPLNSHDYFHGNFMAFWIGSVWNDGESECTKNVNKLGDLDLNSSVGGHRTAH